MGTTFYCNVNFKVCSFSLLISTTLIVLFESGTGLILETYVNEFTNFALFSPVVTALAGNAGSILVSRISTSLHSNKKEPIGIVSITLFLITCPVLLLFLIFVWATGQLVGGWSFAIGYCVVVAASVS